MSRDLLLLKTSNMENFVTIVNGFYPTNTPRHVFDVETTKK